MIKSPCRDCNKHELEFPNCFDNCERIKEAQRLANMYPSHTRDTTTYVPSENHSFTNKTHKHAAMS